MNCDHQEFIASVGVYRLTDATGMVVSYQTDLRVECKSCGCPFEFLGLLPGMDGGRPTVSADGCEMRVPVKPLSMRPKLSVVTP